MTTDLSFPTLFVVFGFGIQGPGWKNQDSDKHPGSVTLVTLNGTR
jgi:hypothetical protein